MTLVRTVTPYPDESLPGLVARAAGLNVYPSFTAMVEAELLTIDDDGRVPYTQVTDLAGKFIFANEAGVRSRRGTGQVRSWLAAHGVQPEQDLGVKNGLLFDRAKVEPLLEMKA